MPSICDKDKVYLQIWEMLMRLELNWCHQSGPEVFLWYINCPMRKQVYGSVKLDYIVVLTIYRWYFMDIILSIFVFQLIDGGTNISLREFSMFLPITWLYRKGMIQGVMTLQIKMRDSDAAFKIGRFIWRNAQMRSWLNSSIYVSQNINIVKKGTEFVREYVEMLYWDWWVFMWALVNRNNEPTNEYWVCQWFGGTNLMLNAERKCRKIPVRFIWT